MNHYYKISYENVYLRPLEENDIESLRGWRNNPQNTVFLSNLPYITQKMQKEWFNKYLQSNEEMCFAIVEICDLNRIVGSLCLYDFSQDSCFFGKILVGDEEAHGRKIGLNATKAAVKLAFEQLRMKEIKLYVYSENKCALKVYKKAGFIVLNEHNTEDEKKEYTMIIRQEEIENA